jgi:hypothetical protein
VTLDLVCESLASPSDDFPDHRPRLDSAELAVSNPKRCLASQVLKPLLAYTIVHRSRSDLPEHKSVQAVALDEGLVDRDPETGPVGDLDLALDHRKILDRELVQHRVGTERVFQDEAAGGDRGDL